MFNRFKTIIFTFLLVGSTSSAWEVNTHRAIDRCALSDECGSQQRSVDLHQFVQDTGIGNDNYEAEVFDSYTTLTGAPVTYFNYVLSGEHYGVSKWNQSFASHGYRDLIEAGTILEDALSPGLNVYVGASFDPRNGDGRFGNHFLRPAERRCRVEYRSRICQDQRHRLGVCLRREQVQL